jgi:hypothetical protein
MKKEFKVGDRVAGDWSAKAEDGYKRVRGIYDGMWPSGSVKIRASDGITYGCAPRTALQGS